MRQTVVARELDALGIDQQQAEVVRGHLEQQAGDESVDAHALALAGGSGDQQVRHAREVGDDRLSRYVIAQAQGELVGALAERGRLENFANRHEAGRFIRHLDAHRRLTRDRGFDAQRRGGQRQRQVILQRGDALDLDPRTGLDLELRDRGSRVDADDLALDPERLERALDDPDVALDLVRHPLAARGHRIEQRDRGQLPLDLGQVILRLGDDPHHRLGTTGRLLIGRLLATRLRAGLLHDLILGLVDLPQALLARRGRGGRKARRGAGEHVAGRRSSLGRFRFLRSDGADQVAEPSPFGVGCAQRSNRADEKSPGAEVDGHDEPDHEAGDKQRPRANTGEKARQARINAASNRPPGSGGETEQPDQRKQGDQAGHHVDRARPRRLRPQQPRAEGDRRRHGYEPGTAEKGNHAVANPAQNHAGVAQDR